MHLTCAYVCGGFFLHEVKNLHSFDAIIVLLLLKSLTSGLMLMVPMLIIQA